MISEFCARAVTSLGLTSFLELCPRHNSVLGLVYHRILDWRNSPHNQDIFSADADAFAD